MYMNKLDTQNIKNFVKEVVRKDFPSLDEKHAYSFIEKAFITKLIHSTNKEDLDRWYKNIFIPNSFSLDSDDYSEAAIQSLRIVNNIAATDYGTSRQRDFGQKWADLIRGYLGELGVKKVFKKKCNIDIDLGHDPGELEEYLPKDIHRVKTQSDVSLREPNLSVSIKAIKSNGMWLDIPGAQINHSDIFIVSVLGIGTDHLFSFFKEMSVFTNKILPEGRRLKIIDHNEEQRVLETIPNFTEIIGYVPGFQLQSIDSNFTYDGNMGRTNFTITNWAGKPSKENLEKVKEDTGAKKVNFEGIGVFSNPDEKYVYGIGELRSSDSDWQVCINNKI